jgi:ecdysteroid kinase
MSVVITAVEQVTPEWLTSTLQRAGALPQGRVKAVHRQGKDTYTAKAFPLIVDYSDDSPPSTPKRLFLKLGRRKPEVDFYNFILPQSRHIPTVRCYSAAFANELGQSHVLMDDVSETHYEPPDSLPPHVTSCEQILDILADLHSAWWEHPSLRTDLAPVIDNVPEFISGHARNDFAHFVDSLGDRLSEKRRNYYERILAGWPLPTWKERIDSHRAVTLVHGDSHWWNFLFPRETGSIYLMDWAVWHLNIGVSDLAYMFGQLCFHDWRDRFEQRLVQYYHARLVEHGVKGYDWAQCWQDYRLTMVFHALWPIFHHQWAPNSIWWRNLECCMTAFEDLGCEEFLA